MNRRGFLRNTTTGVVGAGMVGVAVGREPLAAQEKPVATEPEKLKIKEYRTLGRTGFKVSDISSGYVDNPVIIKAIFDAGVNYVDSAEGYGNEAVVGKTLKSYDRSKFFITTKLELEPGKDLSKGTILARAYKCLERLQSDYIDCMMIHGPEDPKLVTCEGFHDAMKQLKSEKKLRHIGISNHGSNWADASAGSMAKVLLAAA
jgi:aryl-alcohol dehydrogenase-like predicted oxidoreductase